MKFNTQIAESLGMEIPQDDEPDTDLIVVEPHEIVSVDNPELPPMHDIERRSIEGEKQLEMVINESFKLFKLLEEGMTAVEPKYRNRHIEVLATVLRNGLAAIKHKNDLQLEKKKMRLKEADFIRKRREAQQGGITSTVIEQQNVFVGNREDVLKSLMAKKPEDAESGK